MNIKKSFDELLKRARHAREAVVAELMSQTGDAASTPAENRWNEYYRFAILKAESANQLQTLLQLQAPSIYLQGRAMRKMSFLKAHGTGYSQ